MADPQELRAAVAAGALGAEDTQAALLRSIVDVARAIFAARASSIMLYDEPARELEFAAVSGEGADFLVGRRISSASGIAGWVATARQPVVLEDVGADPRFARDVAESTGFVPRGLMAAPLLLGERVIGVLSVLDRPQQAHFTLSEMELLGSFAVQAALALDLVQRARTVRRVLAGGPSELEDLARLAEQVAGLEDDRHDAGRALITALVGLLRG
jgi:GAF domain-containing protein